MKKLGTAVLLAFLSIAAPAMAQEQKLLHVEEASDPDSREQETRQTIRQNCVAEHVDEAVCDRITGLDINKAPGK